MKDDTTKKLVLLIKRARENGFEFSSWVEKSEPINNWFSRDEMPWVKDYDDPVRMSNFVGILLIRNRNYYKLIFDIEFARAIFGSSFRKELTRMVNSDEPLKYILDKFVFIVGEQTNDR